MTMQGSEDITSWILNPSTRW